MIRFATMDDLPGSTKIYNQAIASKTAVGDTVPFTPQQRMPWFLSHIENERTPLYVFVDSGAVAGYCCLEAYRPGRQALAGVAEISYFVHSNHHRRGIGDSLVHHTIQAAGSLGYHSLLAVVLSCNQASTALLTKHGFAHWGTLPDIVRIDGHIHSHLYYGLRIAD